MMVEVCKNLYVGDGDCWLEGGSLLCCAKEPWHREALWYGSVGAPKGHPEYYFARRGDILILNLVDAETVEYIPDVVVNEGLRFISERIVDGRVLVFCNRGESRAPGMALLWMWENGLLPREWSEVGREFVKIYPNFRPGRGIFEFIKRRICK